LKCCDWSSDVCSSDLTIVSDWKVVRGEFRLNLTLPANTTATVSLPISDNTKVREGRGPAGKAEGVRFIGREGGRSLFVVGSGVYRFAGPISKEQPR
jgi:alpha-L-rhamnosidase